MINWINEKNHGVSLKDDLAISGEKGQPCVKLAMFNLWSVKTNKNCVRKILDCLMFIGHQPPK